MITEKQILRMVELQSKLNRKIDKHWTTAGHDWGLAIMDECMELINQVGWKWWKDTPTPQLTQVQLEVVDIWHFILSAVIDAEDTDRLVRIICAEPDVKMHGRSFTPHEVIRCAKALCAQAECSQPWRLLPTFFMLMRHVRLSFDDLYRLYVAKIVLNELRQENGYQDGTYMKLWGGVEDNVKLEQLMEAHPSAEPGRLLNLLRRQYRRYQTLPA